jgi:hypothetical protein
MRQGRGGREGRGEEVQEGGRVWRDRMFYLYKGIVVTHIGATGMYDDPNEMVTVGIGRIRRGLGAHVRRHVQYDWVLESTTYFFSE